jgi:hypothetical protein
MRAKYICAGHFGQFRRGVIGVLSSVYSENVICEPSRSHLHSYPHNAGVLRCANINKNSKDGEIAISNNGRNPVLYSYNVVVGMSGSSHQLEALQNVQGADMETCCRDRDLLGATSPRNVDRLCE